MQNRHWKPSNDAKIRIHSASASLWNKHCFTSIQLYKFSSWHYTMHHLHLSTCSSIICCRSCNTGNHSPPFSQALMASWHTTSSHQGFRKPLASPRHVAESDGVLGNPGTSDWLGTTSTVISTVSRSKIWKNCLPSMLASRNRAWVFLSVHSCKCKHSMSKQRNIDTPDSEILGLWPFAIVLLFRMHSSQRHRR